MAGLLYRRNRSPVPPVLSYRKSLATRAGSDGLRQTSAMPPHWTTPGIESLTVIGLPSPQWSC
jgi:hypothetical protein